MPKSIGIYKIYPKSFRANVYSINPFRMIGLIDVDIAFEDSIERVTIPFFRSSGTNNGKILGLWYPIVGVKVHSGKFTEFTRYINFMMTKATKNGQANKGWLAKSIFFFGGYLSPSRIRGFSSGKHYESLLWIGESLRDLYEKEKYIQDYSLIGNRINEIILSKDKYENNKRTQRENFEKLIEEVYKRY